MYQGRKKENIQTRATFFPLTKHLSSEYLKVAFFWIKLPSIFREEMVKIMEEMTEVKKSLGFFMVI